MPNQHAATRAERRPHRQLALARDRARQQQVGHVGAGDEQDEKDGAHQREQRRPHVGDEVLANRLHVEVQARGLLGGESRSQLVRDAIDVRLRFGNRDARLEAADDADADVVAVALREVDAEGCPEVRPRVDAGARAEQQLGARLQHADHFNPLHPELDDLADDFRIAAVVTLPELVTENPFLRRRQRSPTGAGRRRGVRRRVGRILIRRRRDRKAVGVAEIAPAGHAQPEHGENVGRGLGDVDLDRLAVRPGHGVLER